ncbi:glycosyltransferase family 4 protein [Thermotoga profunda]|uniref:glycosyltransferase family 4 protein n=1 Tax=Thermotoga profunda TaxID=1508420 RepID=UPI000597B6EC|nr:glycosyltransferase family 4 protein [Thermotoga profunda]
MRIALVHFRAGQTDGVSLEMEKWKTVLEKMRHDVFYVAGELNQIDGIKIPSLSMENPTNLWIHKNAFEGLSVDQETFIKVFEEYVFQIKKELEMANLSVDLLIVNNVLSLGFNLAAAVAITEYARSRKIKIIGHHHDFYWERERYSRPQSDFVAKILDEYFPPKDNGIFHITINGLAQKELFKRKGIRSMVIPNVFDFDQPAWRIDDYNRDLRKSIGIDERDIVILHGTRIVQRKAIEIAMDFVEYFFKMSKDRVHFVIAGFFEQESEQYYQKLLKKAQMMSYKTHFVFEKVRSTRFVSGKKYYSLWDMYAISNAITYTSVLEGWGNQLIEAVFSKKPLVIFEYPVYKSDIAPLGFDFVSLGDEVFYDKAEGLYRVDVDVLKKAARRLSDLLSNEQALSENVEKNFEIGKKYLSLQSLQGYLQEILSRI